jgi:hypothetical protein
MTTTTSPSPTVAAVWRQHRLARGWEPVQLIGRLRIAASRDGHDLPKTYQLVRDVFEWENHRTELPGDIARWLHYIFTTTAVRG